MCGIVGIHSFNDHTTVSSDALLAMNQQIFHRGPDEGGHQIFGPVGLAMRRLSIIDLSGGHQPMSNEDESVWVVFNGEIYDFQDLRNTLVQAGYKFKTHCDTEVLLHAYEMYGDDFVSKCNGMFGFAIWDKKMKKLVLGRDRLGKKPLYYYKDSEKLVFASELKALFAYPGLPRDINPAALDEFMTWEYVLGPQTILKNVFELKPGHIMTVQNGKMEERPFWTAQIPAQKWTLEEGSRVLRQTLKDAVRRRMISDVPLGAFLSGGIDSSIIVGLMAELSSQPVKTFSIGFNDKTYNESEYARMVAKKFGTDHHEFMLDIDPRGFIDDFFRYLDEPNGDVSLIPTYLVSKMARTKVTVCLSGDGGDELFAGYDSYLADQMACAFQARVPAFAEKSLGALAHHLPPSKKKKGLVNRIKRFFEGLENPADVQHYRWMNFMNEAGRKELYSDSFRASFPVNNAFKRLNEHFSNAHPSWDRLIKQSYVDLNVYLVEDILSKVDITSMANSLEVRVPFLDYHVVELALSMPADLKMHAGVRKRVLKEAFKDLLPPEIQNRKKEGFSIPLKNWLRNDLKERMTDILNPNSIKAAGYFSWKGVERMMKEHIDGRQNHAHRLWCLMVFQMWCDKYLNSKGAVPASCGIEAAPAA